MAGEKRIAIAGVTGFVGRGLPRMFREHGFRVTGISRSGKGDVPGVEGWLAADAPDLSGHSAVVNLAGEPVDQRWTDEAKRRLRESRVDYTAKLVEAIHRLPAGDRPKMLLNGSAVGYYGDRGDEFLTEEAPVGDGFLAELCKDWEQAAFRARGDGLRVVTLRIGLVLGNGGGIFEKLGGIFKWGLGGRLGDGKQWMPWIHLDDLRRAIVHAVVSPTLEGPLNGSAPAPERNVDFTRELAAAVKRPALFPVPAFALKLSLGEFSSALLSGQRAVPSALVEDGFSFRFTTLEKALKDLTGK